ncbi:cornifin alpha-like isoform X1 [Bufo bufo]|uniref:cornifin alpha-like isoform X1 n=1 Tax=Bufo bufo TaxID=8384 RepID=UPI001ABEC624|nr:cornifin alpha-like isoform X1 [Bufo bufo]
MPHSIPNCVYKRKLAKDPYNQLKIFLSCAVLGKDHKVKMSGVKGGHQKTQCKDPCQKQTICQDPCQKQTISQDPCQKQTIYQDPCQKQTICQDSCQDPCKPIQQCQGYQKDPCNPCVPDPCQSQGKYY